MPTKLQSQFMCGKDADVVDWNHSIEVCECSVPAQRFAQSTVSLYLGASYE